MGVDDEMRLAGLCASAIDLALRDRGVSGLLALHLAVHVDGRFSSWPTAPKIPSLRKVVAVGSMPIAAEIRELVESGIEDASLVELLYAERLAREAAGVLACAAPAPAPVPAPDHRANIISPPPQLVSPSEGRRALACPPAEVACPACGKSMRISSSSHRRTVHCVHCTQAYEVGI